MTSPCLDPTTTAYQKMLEAIAFCEFNRADADEVIASYRPEIARDLTRHHKLSGMRPPDEREIDVAAELRASHDSAFKNALLNERWGWRLALMYAEQHRVDQEMQTQNLLATLVDEIRGLRRELREDHRT